MFDNVSKKIKICAIIYFFGSFLDQGYYLLSEFIGLGSDFRIMTNTIISLVYSAIIYLIISVIIYGFGCIVNYYETLKSEESFSNFEK